MSQETQWFQDHGLDDQHERCYWRRIGFILTAALALAVILAPLVGCATQEKKEEPRNEVCSFQLLGQTSSGMPVVAMTCVPPEAFAAAQK